MGDSGTMTDSRKLNIALVAVATIILVASCATFAYTLVPKGDVQKVVVNGKDYSWDAVFTGFQSVNFTANGGNYTGVKLSDIVNDSGLTGQVAHQYTLTGSDGYSKTVTWNDMMGGYLVLDEKKAIFPGLTRSFWVKGVITIEVV